jgi:hypothetical protein
MTVGKFAGDKGAEAFAELRKLSKDGKLKDVRGLPSLNQAQVALVAGEGSTLTNVLNSFPDDVSRSRALGVLDMQVQKGNGELMEEIIRTKGKV